MGAKTIKRLTFQEAVEMVEGAQVRDGYSGRGMYGQCCPAVELESAAGISVFAGALAARIIVNAVLATDDPQDMEDAAEDAADAAVAVMQCAQADSMGIRLVLYFPGLELA